MVQNLRAHFILHVITIKYMKCVQEKIEFSSMLERPRLISSKILGDVSLATKIKQQQKISRKFSGVLKRWHPVAQGCSCHPMATGLHS